MKVRFSWIKRGSTRGNQYSSKSIRDQMSKLGYTVQNSGRPNPGWMIDYIVLEGTKEELIAHRKVIETTLLRMTKFSCRVDIIEG